MWILNAHVPLMVLGTTSYQRFAPGASGDFVLLNLELQDDRYGQIHLASPDSHPTHALPSALPSIDQRGGMVLPCFVDSHTHLDKGQMWGRSPNPQGDFPTALQQVLRDAQTHWTTADLRQRMEFGLRCSYAHGTQAIRTHLDSGGAVGLRVWRVFQELKTQWHDRLTLQGVSLVFPDYYQTAAGQLLLDQVCEAGGILGAVLFNHPQLAQQVQQLFTIAEDRGLALDLHVDESLDPQDQALRQVALTKLERGFTGQVICGHCCSLGVQPPEPLAETIALVKEAELGLVSLPLCNLYLQDRQPHRTPRLRGVTALQELKAAGVPLALASDNCRDPFYAYGDHDGLEVFRESTRIAQLDSPHGDWIRSVTQTPAAWLGVEGLTQIEPGAPANLILFNGRNWNELLSRPENDRRIFRHGQEITPDLPDYRELDPLFQNF